MAEELKYLLESIDALIRSAEKDAAALKKLSMDESLFEDYEKQRIVNSFLFNYTKIQDKMGSRLFRSLLMELREPVDESMSMRDILDRLEKLRFLENTQDWDRLREIRNTIAHEYLLDLRERLENVTLAIEAFERLQSIYARIVSAR